MQQHCRWHQLRPRRRASRQKLTVQIKRAYVLFWKEWRRKRKRENSYLLLFPLVQEQHATTPVHFVRSYVRCCWYKRGKTEKIEMFFVQREPQFCTNGRRCNGGIGESWLKKIYMAKGRRKKKSQSEAISRPVTKHRRDQQRTHVPTKY